MKKYYHAYDDRYKSIHQKGFSWASDKPTLIVKEIIDEYQINKESSILELGCGEGRDTIYLLNNGYHVHGTDSSKEAIRYCRQKSQEYKDNFFDLDFINDKHSGTYDFIYAVAVLHMLVLDEDRKAFYQFIYNHLNNNGVALITSMGDGEMEMKTNINKAFDIVKRDHYSGEIEVASTSCRMVSFANIRKEIKENNLIILKEGIVEALPEFDKLMFFVIKKIKNKKILKKY